MSERKKVLNVLVHDGPFHADDVFAVALLKYHFGKDAISVTRSRTLSPKNFDMVLDIHRKFDGVKYFDHHQGNLFWDNGIPKATFGLLFDTLYSRKLEPSVFKNILEILVYPIDARDNGFLTTNAYLHLGLWVEHMLPGWVDKNPNKMTEKFNDSVDMAYNIIKSVIEKALLKPSAAVIVEDAMSNSVYKSVLILNIAAPWKKVVRYSRDLRFVAHPRDGSPGWNLQSINKLDKTYELEEAIPRTVDQYALFVHNSRHLATFESKEKLFEAIDKCIATTCIAV